MGRRLTISISDEIAECLQDAAQRKGISVGRIVRQLLETAMYEANPRKKPFLRLAGSFDGPGRLSTRKGFARN